MRSSSSDGARPRRVRLPEVLVDERLEALHGLVRAEKSLADFLRALARGWK